MLIFVKEFNILPQNGPEAERSYVGGQRRGCGSKYIILNANRECGYQGNGKKIKRCAITVVATLMRIKVGESTDTFGIKNSEGWIVHASQRSSNHTNPIFFPCGAIELAQSHKDVK